MELDRHAIERQDFPVSRRGYDPASVDAHLRGVANQLEELARARAGDATTLASAAGTQVQSILASAESLAADMKREASAEAARAREDAVAQSRAHVAAVAAAAATLLERVTAVERELGAVLGSAHAAAAQLARDLESLGHEVGTLYDAAGAHREAGAAEPSGPKRFPIPTEVPGAAASADERAHADVAAAGGPAPEAAAPPAAASEPAVSAAQDGDIDGARLIALNMALSGETREETDRYLAANFTLTDRARLIEEVYAAIDA